jgi:hypothetical protein
MNEFQRVIKYCAMAFAIFLAIVIISGIASAAFAIVSTVSGGKISVDHGKTIDVDKTFTDVKSLDIDNSTGNLKIIAGDEFRVVAEKVSDNFTAEVKNGKLKVSEDDDEFHFLWFNVNDFNSPNSKITLYVPTDFVAEDVNLDTGAGNTTIEGLHTEDLFISAGAGNIDGSELTAEKVKIDGGVGNVSFNDVNFTDANFDCGVGNLNIDGILLGKSEFDCGVGNVDIDLIGNTEDYDLDIDSGVGTVRLNGDKISDSKIDNDADNSIKVDGGVGDVNIKIEQ